MKIRFPVFLRSVSQIYIFSISRKIFTDRGSRRYAASRKKAK